MTDWIDLVSIILGLLPMLYEFFAWLRRRPDDGPSSPLQLLIAIVARIIYLITGRIIAFPKETTYVDRYKQRLVNRSTMSLTRKSTLRLRRRLLSA